MSLQSLIELRKSGSVPGAVWVIVGNTPKWLPDSPDYIVVNPNNIPTDFRALVGLHVDVFELFDADIDKIWRLEALYDAIEASKPKSVGLANADGFSGLNASS